MDHRPRSFGKDRVKLYLGPSQRVPLQAARKLYFVVEKMPFAAPGYRRLIEQDVALLKRQSGISVLKENRHVIILRYKPPSPR